MTRRSKKLALAHVASIGIPAGLRASAHDRTTEVVGKLNAAMKSMAQEIQNNDGLYPFNKGRLSQAEVCRRADVDEGTLQNRNHKETTRRAVGAWLTNTKAGAISGSANIRKTVTARVDKARTDEKLIATNYHIARLELQDARRDIKRLQAELKAEREAKVALGQVLRGSGGKVISLRRPKDPQQNN